MTRLPDQPHTSAESEPALGRTARIRELNDQLRRGELPGRVMITPGVAMLGLKFTTEALGRVAMFDTFDNANDPYGEHDFGLIVLNEQRLFWKIDYYDASLSAGAEDPADPTTCARVLTLMLSSEY